MSKCCFRIGMIIIHHWLHIYIKEEAVYEVACMRTYAHTCACAHACGICVPACMQHLCTFAGVCVLAWHDHLMLACTLHL